MDSGEVVFWFGWTTWIDKWYREVAGEKKKGRTISLTYTTEGFVREPFFATLLLVLLSRGSSISGLGFIRPGSFGLGGTKRVVRFVPPESFLGDSECVNGPTFRLASICSARILEQPS